MAKEEKRKKAVPGALSGLSYEKALKRLEAIVEEMEGDDLPLETLIARYEEGMRLRKLCLDKLAEAEGKIRVLEESLESEFSLKSLTEEENSQ